MRISLITAAVLPTFLFALPLDAQNSIVITRGRSARHDLASVRAMDTASHVVFRVYFDSTGRSAAMASIPVLAKMYAQLGKLTGSAPPGVEWAAVAFVRDTGYTPPRIGDEVRWSVTVESSGQIGERGEHDLYVVLPHEQVHSIQSSMSGGAPRWFQEGQAEWAGLQVTEQWRPQLALARRHETFAAFNGRLLHLALWGTVKVKPEAILRGMTPEQRARHARDSTYMPPGPYTFGPGDLISDESESMARYGASLALFTKLEHAKGRQSLVEWFEKLWDMPTVLTTHTLTESARVALGVDLGPMLR